MSAIIRNVEPKLLKLLSLFPVVCVLGVRQAGKTTLSKGALPDWKYIDLERPSDFSRVSTDTDFFLEEYSGNLIIDEAQLYPELFQTLRGVVDRDREKTGRFLLTGSSSPELLEEVSESLAGRVAILKLSTLKANEYYGTALSDFYNIFSNKQLTKDSFPLAGPAPLSKQQMQRHWVYGGYPEPTAKLEQEDFYNLWMQNYFDTYVNRDLAKLFPRLNKQNYQRFIGMLARLSGTILNQNEIARALEISAPTVKEYLDIASGTYIWQQLPSFETDVVKSTVKMPKGYIADTGLLHYLLGIQDYDSLYFDPISGRSFEGFVIGEILKGIEASNITNCHPYYYRTKNGAELDLVIRYPNGLLPIEIKQGIKIQRSDLKHMQHFMETHPKCSIGIIINQSEKIEWLTPNIVQLPIGFL